ncbi:SusC/RagA family TonB-linked outer membrane protein [Natronoflexus pectinivorans]|uniref:TonB-linked SusC/RagA family outer membrane protein n=1 Tax=Natronoflexus pectinivorans TaxID=682526 RepID=A0A4R2GIM7_9BACT|nr:TonB-dependent receptor [Natronoflexus pectinivorans]TCO08439.1 TonB-linked SusC/RagA family outer membrane protein [Natronoflexus pectinivorans]
MKKTIQLIVVMVYFTFSGALWAQERVVTGTVTDDMNEPIPGVTIVVQGTSIGSISDFSGNYQINVPEGSEFLVFSSIGFDTQTIEMAGRSVVNVQMTSSILGLDEVIVIGYGSVRRSDVTGAVARVSGDQINTMASADPVLGLQGRLAGVDVVSNSGEPGSGTRIRVRGIGTINNSSPLYVVDGFPMGDMSNVDPSNIESIEVLKDASATAIYGSRGANGVILVTTRTGRSGAPVFNVNAYAGAQMITRRLDLTNAHEFATLRKESYTNAGLAIPNVEMLDYVIANNLKGTNWQDELFNVAPIQNYSLSVSGGTDNMTYNIGGTYNSQEGTIKYSGIDKLFLFSNTQYHFSDRITLGVNLSYTHYEKHNNNNAHYGGSLTDGLQMDPLTVAWDDYTGYYGERFLTGGVTIQNPARIVDEAKYNTSGAHRLISNFDLNIKNVVFEGLDFKTMFASDLNFTNDKSFYPEFYIAPDQMREKSSLYENRGFNNNWVWNGYFTYNRREGSHNINATLGMETQEFNWNGINATVYDVPFDENLMYFDQAQDPEQRTVGGGASKVSLMSYFGRLNYSFDNRYLFTATMRADGSSKFIGDNKWGYFPSFSTGWNIHEENFMSDVYALNQLRLRAGWGQVGNEGSVSPNAYLATMNTGYHYVFGGRIVDGARTGALSNPDLKWEVTEQVNVGLDMLLLNSRLNVSLDWFNRDTKDMILRTPIPTYVGSGRPYRNAGTMNNTGFEFSAAWSEQIGEFNYGIGITGSMIQNEVTSLAGGEPISGGGAQRLGSVTRTEEGFAMAYFYGLKTDGIFRTQEELDAHVWVDPNTGAIRRIQPNASVGDVRFVDTNKDGRIDDDDRVKLGSAIPDFTGSLNLELGYRGWDFRAFFYGVFGVEAVNVYRYYSHTSGPESNYHRDRLNRWTPDNINTNEPRMVSNDPNRNNRFSDRYVEDASYIRLRNIQLGYTFNRGIIDRLGLSRVRIYCNADNLITITNYTGFNPEVGGWGLSGGVDYVTYPMAVTITGGINISF